MNDRMSIEEQLHELAEYLNKGTDVAGHVMREVQRISADSAAGKSTARPARRMVPRVGRYAALLTVAAALLVAVLLLRWDRRSVAWAKTVRAVAEKPWLHSMITMPDGKKGESWFSPRHDVMATRSDEYTCWADLEQKTREYYEPKSNTVVRIPDDERGDGFGLFAMVFRAFLSTETGRTIGAGRFKLIHRRQDVVVEGGNRWIEQRFELDDQDNPYQSELGAGEWIVYVAPDTHLPFRLDQIILKKEGKGLGPSKRWVVRYDIDYPEAGPANIYALGVPKTARMIDRLWEPSRAEAKRLLGSVRAARWRSDSYYALVVEGPDDQDWLDYFLLYRTWRSGSRWRVETSSGDVRHHELRPKDADDATWWKQKAEKIRFVPYEVCDGKWLWRYKNTGEKSRQPAFPPGLEKGAYIYNANFHPEYFARPLAHLLSPEDAQPNDVKLNAKPTSGPPHTLLLEVHDSNPGGYPQIWRFWVDPERGYLVMRYEELVARDGKEEIIRRHAIEGVTQDPDGQWYPTVIRISTRRTLTEKLSDSIMRCYYNFTSPMADSLFKAD
ncbi:MAG: hypothetical protein ACLQNE_35160 [Thermoguttaceae bacterium]